MENGEGQRTLCCAEYEYSTVASAHTNTAFCVMAAQILRPGNPININGSLHIHTSHHIWLMAPLHSTITQHTTHSLPLLTPPLPLLPACVPYCPLSLSAFR